MHQSAMRHVGRRIGRGELGDAGGADALDACGRATRCGRPRPGRAAARSPGWRTSRDSRARPRAAPSVPSCAASGRDQTPAAMHHAARRRIGPRSVTILVGPSLPISKPLHVGIHDLAAAAHEIRGQRTQVSRNGSMVRWTSGSDTALIDLGRQRRLHLPRLVAVEDVHVHAVAAPQVERVGGALERRLALEGHHQAVVGRPTWPASAPSISGA